MDLEALDKVLDQELVLGGNEQRAVLERDDFPTERLAALGPLWFLHEQDAVESLVPTVTYATIDLDTGQASPLTLSADPHTPIATDGVRAAWVDRTTGTVTVQTIATGALSTYLDGQVDQSWDVQTLAGDVLLLAGTLDVASSARVFNLATGADSVMAGSENVSVFAFTDGQWVVVQYNTWAVEESGDGAANGGDVADIPMTTQIDLIDTTDGSRSTILVQTNTQDLITLLGVGAGRVVWLSYPDISALDDPTVSISTVEAYTITTGQTTALGQITAATSNGFTSPLAVGEEGVLLMDMTEDMQSKSFTLRYQLLDWDGQMQLVVETSGQFTSYPEMPMAALAGRYVLYEDVDNGGWVIYDPVAQTGRAVQPF